MTIRQGREKTEFIAAAASIAVLAALVYSNTIGASFQFDDYHYVLDYNRTHGLESFWPPHGTRYLAYLSFALNHLASGEDPAGYHAANIAIHAVNGLLVYLFVNGLARTPRLSGRVPAFETAFLAAMLFTAHPVQTEAVTYISQRFASLVTLFYLLSAVAYLAWRRSGASAPARAALYALSLLSCYAAQVTKEIGFTLPFVLVLLELAFFTGPVRRLRALVPFVLATAVIPWALFGPDLGTAAGVGADVREQQLRDLRIFSAHDYLATQFRVVVTYLRLLVAPMGQSIEYDYPVYRSFLDPAVAASFVFLLALFAGAVWLFARSLKTGAAHLSLISAGVLWFFITISVESSIIPIKDVIFEHRLYLPSAGAAMAASALLFHLFSRRRALAVLAAGAVLFVLPLGVAAYERNKVWENEVTLYEDAAMKSPGKERARYNLAWGYHKRGMLDRAAEEYLEVLKIAPGKEKAHYNLAMIYRGRGEADKAAAHFREALAINPGNGAGWYNLAMIYHGKGELKEAIGHYLSALKAEPHNEDARYNLAVAYLESGDAAEAATHLSEILRRNPGSADALYQLGRVYVMEKDTRRAYMAFTEALKIRPDLTPARAELMKLEGAR